MGLSKHAGSNYCENFERPKVINTALRNSLAFIFFANLHREILFVLCWLDQGEISLVESSPLLKRSFCSLNYSFVVSFTIQNYIVWKMVQAQIRYIDNLFLMWLRSVQSSPQSQSVREINIGLPLQNSNDGEWRHWLIRWADEHEIQFRFPHRMFCRSDTHAQKPDWNHFFGATHLWSLKLGSKNALCHTRTNYCLSRITGLIWCRLFCSVNVVIF